MNHRSRSASLAAAALALAAHGPAGACSCVPTPPVLQAAADSYMVFSGRVLRVEEASERARPPGETPFQELPENMLFEEGLRGGGVRVTFAVDAVWHGPHQPKVELYTGPSQASCGLPFRVGEAYVVFVDRLRGGTLMTGLCSRTKPIAAAGEELMRLGVAAWRPPAPSQ